MKESLTLLIIAFMALTGYCIHIASKHKALHSISESDYWLEKPFKWVFEAVMFLCGGSLLYTGYNGFNEHIYTLIIGGVGICLVGLFSRYRKNDFISFWHAIGAAGGYFALMISFAIELHMWWYSLIVFASLVFGQYLSANRSIKTWNTEILMSYAIFAGLIGKLIILL